MGSAIGTAGKEVDFCEVTYQTLLKYSRSMSGNPVLVSVVAGLVFRIEVSRNFRSTEQWLEGGV